MIRRTHAPSADVAVIWLGEMLLFPHLWPIVDALARTRPDLIIDIWISTSVHEQMVADRLSADHANIRLRRAPGYRSYPKLEPGFNPPMPAKIPMLFRLAPKLRHVPVALCAEQTSLWLAKYHPGTPDFIFTVHGAGPLNYGRARRLTHAARLLVPSELDVPNHVAHGIRRDRIAVTGYAKSSFRPSWQGSPQFDPDKPTLLYAPHWQQYRSSWWAWGREIVDRLTQQGDWNVILAPHQRLLEEDPAAGKLLDRLRDKARVHVDTGSFALVDGSYTAAADLYLGDTSSQILEYLARPRPCVLLRPPGLTWNPQSSGDYWRCGEVVGALDQLGPALERAERDHRLYADAQVELATAAVGEIGADAPARAAAAIGELVDSKALPQSAQPSGRILPSFRRRART